MKKRCLPLLLMPLLFLCACKQINLYEYNTTISNYQWKQHDVVKGKFIISDTTASYNIYLVLRHTDSYRYNNIWLSVGLAPKPDSMYEQKINLTLGNDAAGWEGFGMNDIWEVRKLITGTPRRFIKGGEYGFSIRQIMRDNPLDGVVSAGLRVEKIN